MKSGFICDITKHLVFLPTDCWKMIADYSISRAIRGTLLSLGIYLRGGYDTFKCRSFREIDDTAEWRQDELDLGQLVKRLERANDIGEQWLHWFYVFGYNYKLERIYQPLFSNSIPLFPNLMHPPDVAWMQEEESQRVFSSLLTLVLDNKDSGRMIKVDVPDWDREVFAWLTSQKEQRIRIAWLRQQFKRHNFRFMGIFPRTSRVYLVVEG